MQNYVTKELKTLRVMIKDSNEPNAIERKTISKLLRIKNAAIIKSRQLIGETYKSKSFFFYQMSF